MQTRPPEADWSHATLYDSMMLLDMKTEDPATRDVLLADNGWLRKVIQFVSADTSLLKYLKNRAPGQIFTMERNNHAFFVGGIIVDTMTSFGTNKNKTPGENDLFYFKWGQRRNFSYSFGRSACTRMFHHRWEFPHRGP